MDGMSLPMIGWVPGIVRGRGDNVGIFGGRDGSNRTLTGFCGRGCGKSDKGKGDNVNVFGDYGKK